MGKRARMARVPLTKRELTSGGAGPKGRGGVGVGAGVGLGAGVGATPTVPDTWSL